MQYTNNLHDEYPLIPPDHFEVDALLHKFWCSWQADIKVEIEFIYKTDFQDKRQSSLETVQIFKQMSYNYSLPTSGFLCFAAKKEKQLSTKNCILSVFKVPKLSRNDKPLLWWRGSLNIVHLHYNIRYSSK